MNLLTNLENISDIKNNISSVLNLKIDKVESVFKTDSINLQKDINNKDITSFQEKEVANSIYYFDKKAKEFVLKISKQGINYQFPCKQILKIKEFILNKEKEFQKTTY